MRLPGGAVRSPALWAALGIAAAELTLPRLLHPPDPALGEHHRNPDGRRGWDAYLDATVRPREGERRVLLISNSQGVGRDYPETLIYPTLLERALERPRQKVRVVNWSVIAGHAPEVVALLARAHDLGPDLVVVALGPDSFRDRDFAVRGQPTPLSMFPSDITDTVWLYRDRLPAAFTEHYLRAAAPIQAALARAWPTFPLRERPLAAAAAARPWLRAFVPLGQRFTWFESPSHEGGRHAPGDAPLAVGENAPHPALLAMLVEAGAALGAPRVFIVVPFGRAVDGREEILTALRVGLAGWTLWDLSQALPPTSFLPNPAHLNREGHAALAALLAPRIQTLLDRPGAATP